MRVGIVSDIHDAVEPLRRALRELNRRRVDRIVSLGDAFDPWLPGTIGVDIAALLSEAGAVGVWGNHDAGLSHEISTYIRERADPSVLAFTERLQPRFTLAGCCFSHIEPWRDPRRAEDLWASCDVPDTSDKARPSFEATHEPFIVLGHFHCWLVMRRSDGRVDWDGSSPLELARGEGHLVVVAAVADGWCAMLDTEEGVLTPIPVG
jgi:hypothetical protein